MRLKRERKSVEQRGQSIIEYLALVAVVIATLFIFLGPAGNFVKSYNSVIKIQGDDILNLAQRIFF